MKSKLLFFLMVVAAVSIQWTPAVKESNKSVSLKIDYKFLNIEEGYDHLNKIVVSVDGEEVGASKEQVQSKPGKFTVKIPKGKHEITVMFMAYYEGVWEEHTIENDYSYDCFVEISEDFKRSTKLSIVVDLDSGVTYEVK
jgi:hypothetical protein